MIFTESTFQEIVDRMDREGCPRCGEEAYVIEVEGPDHIRFNCGHIADAYYRIQESNTN